MTGPARGLTGTVEVRSDSAVVTLVGALGPAALPLLGSMLATATSGHGAVTVDVSDLHDVDPAGVAALQQAAGRLRAEHRPLTVLGGGRLGEALRTARLLDASGQPAPAGHDAVLLDPALTNPVLPSALAVRAGSGTTREVLDAALLLVVTMAQAVIGHADGISITLPRDGRYGTVAASNDVVLAMDHDQYDTGQGPCLDAARLGTPVQSDSLAVEERWSRFVPRARERGIATILSSPLRDAGAAHGALNLYARTPGAFADHERRWAHEFAAGASTVLTVAHGALPAGQLDADLEQALASRAVIARAQGWVMRRDGVDADAAWSVLTATSRRTSQPLREVSADLLRDEGGSPEGAGTRGP